MLKQDDKLVILFVVYWSQTFSFGIGVGVVSYITINTFEQKKGLEQQKEKLGFRVKVKVKHEILCHN